MTECAGTVGTLADKRSKVPRRDENQKLRWRCCPRCGGKTRTQIRCWRIFPYSARSANTPA